MIRLFVLCFCLSCCLFASEPRKLVPAEHIVNKASLLPLDLSNKVLSDWMQEFLDKDFSSFQPFNQQDVEATLSQNPYLVCFRIRKGRLFVDGFSRRFKPNGKTSTMCKAICRLMEQKDFSIDNCDFLLNIKDGAEGLQSKVPVFCFSRDQNSNSVLIPDFFSLSEGKCELIEKVKQADAKAPWESKMNIAFWRGGANGKKLKSQQSWRLNPRAALVLFSKEHPDLVRAHFFHGEMNTACPELQSLKSDLGAPWQSPEDSCQYKYLIDVDGWSCGFHRCQWVLWSNCVALKQTSSNIQWYYSGLKPYIHYVPYASDCSDLAEKIQWLRYNDAKARKIAMEGRAFCEENLTLEKCYLYLYSVLKKYYELYSTQN